MTKSHRIKRLAEMSAEILRDPARTGNWEGADKVAKQFDEIARLAEQVDAADTDRLEHLDMTLRACPHAQITFNDDLHSEDGDEEKPFLMEIHGCDSFVVRGATLRDLMDASIEQLAAEKEQQERTEDQFDAASL